MKRPLSLLLTVWSVASIVWCGAFSALAAGATVPAEKLLPPETHFMVTLPSVPEMKKAFAASAFGEMLNSPEMKPFMEGVHKLVEKQSEEMRSKVGFSLNDLCELPTGEFTLAIVEKPPGNLALVIMGDTDPQSQTLVKILDQMTKALSDGGAKQSSSPWRGSTEMQVWEIDNGDPSNPFRKLAYVVDNGFFAIASEPAALVDIAGRWDGTNRTNLGESDVFKYIQEKCRQDDAPAVLKWHLNLMGAIQAGVQMSKSPQAMMGMGFLPVLGLDKFKGMGGVVSAATGEFDGIQKQFTYAEQPTTGILNLFQFPSIEQSPPKWVTADTEMYAGVNWDVQGAYQAVETLVDQFAGPGTVARAIDSWSQQEDAPPIHLKKDLLDQLNGRIHLVTTAAKMLGGAPEVVLGLGLKDPAGMKKTLATVANASGGEVKSREFQGETIYEVPIEAGDTEVTAAVAVADGLLVGSNDVKFVENCIRGNGTGGLAESAAYRDHAKFFPAKCSAISFARQDTQLKAIYDAITTADTSQLPPEIDVKKLPPFEFFKKYLRPAAGYMVTDQRGALSVGFSLKDKK